MNDFPQHKNCTNCNSKSISALSGYESHFLGKCSDCKMVFTLRIPTEKELGDFYMNYSYAGEGFLSPLTIKRYDELLDEFEAYRKTNRILDVGCGRGYFLETALKRGWEVFGTEYSEKAIEICEAKGIQMMAGELNAKSFDQGFDVITSFEVMEHLIHPQKEIANINALLNEGGLLYFTTPNFNSIERRMLKSEFNVIGYPEHLQYFTKETARKLLSNSEMTPLKIKTTGISVTRLRKSKGKTDQAIVSKTSDDEKIREAFESSGWRKTLKSGINFFLDISRLGLSLKVWAVKKPK